nr:MAG TPA: hypothetical protein [Caudoviricetes sp.]
MWAPGGWWSVAQCLVRIHVTMRESSVRGPPGAASASPTARASLSRSGLVAAWSVNFGRLGRGR